MSAVATRLRRAQESRGSPPEACDDDSCRSDTPPNESEEGSEMRDRCLPDNIKSRQSCLKVFIEDRKPAVHSVRPTRRPRPGTALATDPRGSRWRREYGPPKASRLDQGVLRSCRA